LEILLLRERRNGAGEKQGKKGEGQKRRQKVGRNNRGKKKEKGDETFPS